MKLFAKFLCNKFMAFSQAFKHLGTLGMVDLVILKTALKNCWKKIDLPIIRLDQMLVSMSSRQYSFPQTSTQTLFCSNHSYLQMLALSVHRPLSTKVDKERYSTPAFGGKLREGGIHKMDDVTNIFDLVDSIYSKLNFCE